MLSDDPLGAPSPTNVQQDTFVAKYQLSDPDLLSYEKADTELAKLVVRQYGHRINFVVELKAWRVYDRELGWMIDLSGAKIFGFITESVEDIMRAASRAEFKVKEEEASDAAELRRKRWNKWIDGKRSFCNSALNMGKLEAIERRLKVLPGMSSSVKDWDADLTKIVSFDGMIIDLKTGDTRRLTPRDKMVRRMASVYSRTATAPEWEKAIEAIFEGNRALIEYVRRIFFSCLYGEMMDKVFIQHLGDTDTGKTIVTEAVMDLLGTDPDTGYAGSADFSLFEARKAREADVKYEFANLKDARLLSIDESSEDAVLDEARAKRLTGRSKASARHPYGRPFTYTPSFTIFFSSNHMPTIRRNDQGTWNRIKIIPYNHRFRDGVDKDRDLPKKLRREAENGGILNWILKAREGYLAEKLGPEPEIVRAAVSENRALMDRIQEWIEDQLEPCSKYEASRFEDVLKNHQLWFKFAGYKYPLNRATLRKALKDRGIENCSKEERRRKNFGDSKEYYLLGREPAAEGWRVKPDSDLAEGEKERW